MLSLAIALTAAAIAAPLPAWAQTGSENLAPDTDETLQSSAAVVKLTELEKQETTVKLFGTAGGDPAMNGLYTYIAFFGSPADGWSVFKIGDFLDYSVVAEAPGQVTLELNESTMDDASGEIGSRTRRVKLSWKPGADDAPPASVLVTPLP
ncbi:hypothetical protein ACFQ1E_19635 [Sphingomonas canadensis]|uniref:Uncharacterized protein n=1 Tax=Sphingomonas canadensis TaxID=1219257 RepID=A0ABW3HAN9_9SPHN|nr:hypothetical protein [Sphingomonas canadensis]MCW3838251.1 hypothetical protein [Sphingomonas canadensis]